LRHAGLVGRTKTEAGGDDGGGVRPVRAAGAIGRGETGEIHRSCDTIRERTVTITLLPALLARDAEFERRFRRECQIAAALANRDTKPSNLLSGDAEQDFVCVVDFGIAKAGPCKGTTDRERVEVGATTTLDCRTAGPSWVHLTTPVQNSSRYDVPWGTCLSADALRATDIPALPVCV